VAGRNIQKLEDLNGKKVNFSDPGSSTQISARDVFGLLSVSVEEVNMSQADAIAAVKEGEIAATVVISGKPARRTRAHLRQRQSPLVEVPYSGRSKTSIFQRMLDKAYPT